MERNIALIALFAALIGALALLPGLTLASGIPITAQSLGVMLAGTVLGARKGALAVLLYLGLIAIGLPIANQLSIPSHPRDIMSRTGCKWPVEDCDGAVGKYLFCDAPRPDDDKPYCAHHAQMAVATYSAKLITHTIRQAIKP